MTAPLPPNRTGESPASTFPVSGCSSERERLFASSPALPASSITRRLARPHRPNRVHGDCPREQPVLRTGRSCSVALHPALLRRCYGSISHDSSPHRSGLPPLYPLAFSGARAPTSSRLWSPLQPTRPLRVQPWHNVVTRKAGQRPALRPRSPTTSEGPASRHGAAMVLAK